MSAGVSKDASKVRIGVSSCFMHPDAQRPIFKGKTLLYVEQSMVAWVQGGGALAYPVPTVAPGAPVSVDEYIADLDGLLLHGGADVCPRSYGEEAMRPEWEGDEIRDRYEIDLIRRFMDAGKAVLGICRGAQILNVAFGGTLWQDLCEQGATERVHRSQELYDHNVHRIQIEPGSALARLYPDVAVATVNSVHHQGVRALGSGLVVQARSADDGIVEAVRLPGDTYVVGVQWHPEFFGVLTPGEAPDVLDNSALRDEFLAAARSAAVGASS